MQGKDWVMECARLEGMLQEVSCHEIAGIWVAFFSRCQRCRCRQAFKIVQHAEAQRAESIAHQEEMRVSLIDRSDFNSILIRF